jgi:uncharacterized repeat protein (TIGR01451 family)
MNFFSLFSRIRPGQRPLRKRASISQTSSGPAALPGLEALEDRLLLSGNTIHGLIVTGGNSHHAVVSTAPTRTQSFSVDFPQSKTNQSQTRSIPKFDPNLGQLTSIDLVVTGQITSDVQVENEDPSPVTVTGIVSGNLHLSGLDFNTLVTTSATSRNFNAGRWDGVNDFAGSSGKDFGNLTVPGSKTITLTSPTALADYTGTGSVAITETAVATSTATGGGNLLVKVSSIGSGHLTVVYHYLPPADLSITKTASPEPVLTKATLTYTLTVANAGPVAADQVVVRDTLPPGVTYVKASASGWTFSRSGSVVTATLPSMAVGASSVLSIVVKAPPTPGTITNVATVTSQTPDNNLSNNTARAVTHVIAPTAVVSPVIFPPQPSNFPSPTNVDFLSKLDFLAVGGPSSSDPTLRAQATFVDGLYRTILNRPSDLGGLVYWVRALRTGGSRDQVVHALWLSDEHRGIEVDGYFQAFFGHAPDAASRAYWIGVFDSGATETDVVRMMVAGPAYQALHPDNTSFVTALYSDLLARPVDSGGLSSWTQQLQNGASRDAVAGALLHSDESYLRIIDNGYVNILHRGADPGGRAGWLSQFRSGQVNVTTFSEDLLASPEFYNLAVQASQS